MISPGRVGQIRPLSTIATTTAVAPLHRSLEWNPVANLIALTQAVAYHWKEGNINWPMCVYTSLAHVAFAVGLATLSSCQWQTLLLAVALLFLSQLGITGGSHRLWSHRSYKAHWTVRVFLMLCSSLANQDSIYHWARDHRVHHKHTEEDADPHNASRGFFFAHIGWLLLKKHPEVVKAGRNLDFSDLERDPIVMFQHKYNLWLAFVVGFALPGAFCYLAWGEPITNGMLVAGAARYVLCLHLTFLVNSAAHFFGDHPYDEASWPAENPVVSVLTFGEGWHNWHHKYPYDYSASELGASSQFNPTRMFIDAMAGLGLVTGRKRALGAWSMAKEARDRKASVVPFVAASDNKLL